MRSIFLSLVLGVAALGMFALPSTAEAHPGRAHVVACHPVHPVQTCHPVQICHPVRTVRHVRTFEVHHHWRDGYHHRYCR